jgi:hypothetical protein
MSSEVGLKQVLAALPTDDDVESPKKSGRYAIDPRTRQDAAAAAPKSSPPIAAETRPEITQLIELNTLSREELWWIETHGRAAAASGGQPERSPGSSSSAPPRSDRPFAEAAVVFAKPGDDPNHGALTPFYREPTLERVQLQFEDRSLDPAQNPLALSSLLPPPRAAFATFARVTSIAAAALALSGVGYLVAVATLSGPGRSTTQVSSARSRGAPEAVALEQPKPGASAADEVLWSVADMNAAPVAEAPSGPAASPASADPGAGAADTLSGSGGTPDPASAANDDAALPGNPPGAVGPALSRRRLLALRARMRAAEAAQAAAAAQAGLPAQPSRDEIKRSVESARSALQACAGQDHGTFTARITITGAGRVASATIEGAFAGTPQGSCMARSLRGVTFPRFSNPSLQVTYPFRM